MVSKKELPGLRRRWKANKKKQPVAPVSPRIIDKDIESGVDNMFQEEVGDASTLTKEADAVEARTNRAGKPSSFKVVPGESSNTKLATENERLREELAHLSLASENEKLRAEIARLKAQGKKSPFGAQGNFAEIPTESRGKSIAQLIDSCLMCGLIPPEDADTRDDKETIISMDWADGTSNSLILGDGPIDSLAREVPSPMGSETMHPLSSGPTRGCLRSNKNDDLLRDLSKSERGFKGRTLSREGSKLAKFGRWTPARSEDKVLLECNADQRGETIRNNCFAIVSDESMTEAKINHVSPTSMSTAMIDNTRGHAGKGPSSVKSRASSAKSLASTVKRRGRSPAREKGSKTVNSMNLQLNSRGRSSCGRSRSRTRGDAEKSISRARGRSKSKTRHTDAKRSISRARRTTKSVKSARSEVNWEKTTERDSTLSALDRIDKIATRMAMS